MKTRRVVDAESLHRDIGKRIKAERERRNLSQQSVSDLLGMTRAGVANMEAGRQSVLIQHLYNLALAWDCKVTKFLP